jgi:hypothetical protein
MSLLFQINGSHRYIAQNYTAEGADCMNDDDIAMLLEDFDEVEQYDPNSLHQLEQ